MNDKTVVVENVFVCDNQTRGWSDELLHTLTNGMCGAGWLKQSAMLIAPEPVILTEDHVTAACKVWPKDGVEVDKSNGGPFTITRLQLGAYLTPFIGRPVRRVLDGAHRAESLMGLAAVKRKVEPRTVDADAKETKQAPLTGMQANLAQAAYAALSRGENLAAVVELRRAKVITKESDLKRWFKRGLCQKYWHQSTLVLGGVSIKDAGRLDKEQAREASEEITPEDMQGAVSGMLTGTAEAKDKAIPGKALKKYAAAIRACKRREADKVPFMDLDLILVAIAKGLEDDLKALLGDLSKTRKAE